MKENDGLRNLVRGKTSYKKLFKSVFFALSLGFVVIVILALIDMYGKEKVSDGKVKRLSFYFGEYSGTIPLSGNTKLSVSIVFKSDHTFKLTEQRVDPGAKKMPELLIYTGTWEFDEAIEEIELKYEAKAEQITTFSILENETIQIHYLRAQGKRTSGNEYNLKYKKWYQKMFN